MHNKLELADGIRCKMRAREKIIMDAHVLLQCFSATLQADQHVRTSAEEQLRRLAQETGFLGGCLDILAHELEVDPTIKKAAAVYFKNRVVRCWNPLYGQPIDEDEKPLIRERLPRIIVMSDHNTKQQLVPVLRNLVSYDFPKQWPTLLMETCELLQHVPQSSDDAAFSHLYTGLLCFSEICRKFRWIRNEDRARELDPIINQVFPHILNIGNSIVALLSGITELTAEILKLILKCYKFVTFYDLPESLQSREVLTKWGELHGSITNMQPPAYVLLANLSEQEKLMLQVSKCYKWSVANLGRIFTRYASKSLFRNFHHDEFHAMFLNEHIPSLIHTYLAIIESWCNGKRWIAQPALFHIIQFLSHAVTQKETWPLLKPYFENLVSHLIFPLLCPSDHVLEIFETDPHEYIHSNFDIYDDMDSPDTAALGLLVTFVDKRKKTTLEPIIHFAYTQLTSLNSQPETLDVAKKKEGALRLIGGISHYVVVPASPYYSQMEQFLTTLVFPALTSKFDFLKARALEIASKFADLEFKSEESLLMVFNSILNNFHSSLSSAEVSLPVSLECALAIQAYMPMPKFQEVLSQIILPTMSKLLELSNEIDNDAISMVMQECVENFSEQLQPFGVDLMTKLVEQFMRLAYEINELNNTSVDEFNGDIEDNSDKVMAAIGFLNTMITVLLSFENSREICAKLEEVFSPAIEYCLVNQLDDFLAEISELMENSTFLLRYTTPIMWRNFELTCALYENGVALMYVEELTQCLQNFLTFGKDELAKNVELRNRFYRIIDIVLAADSSEIGLNDIIFTAELAQTFVLTLQGLAAEYIPHIINLFLKVYFSVVEDEHHQRHMSFDVNVLNVVISALLYEPALTLQTLQEAGQLNWLFVQWFPTIPKLKRVFDIKLSILGLILLLNNKEVLLSLDASISSNIGPNIIHLVKVLPAAIEAFEKKRTTFSPTDAPVTVDDSWNDESLTAEELDEHFANEDKEHQDSTKEYLDFLQEENSKLKNSGYFDDDDEIVEDAFTITPLHTVNVLDIFRDFVKNIQTNDPQTYSAVFGALNDEQAEVLRSLF